MPSPRQQLYAITAQPGPNLIRDNQNNYYVWLKALIICRQRRTN